MTVDCLGMFSTAPPLPHSFTTSLPAVANHKLAPTFPETKVLPTWSWRCDNVNIANNNVNIANNNVNIANNNSNIASNNVNIVNNNVSIANNVYSVFWDILVL